MRGRLIDISFGFNRKQRVTIELDGDFRESYDALKDTEVDVSIKKFRLKRSLDANAYFHLIVNTIAMARGLSNDEVKQMLVVDYGTLARDSDGQIVAFKLPASVDVSTLYPYTKMYKETSENGRLYKCYLVYKRSSEMDTKEMSHLIDGAINEAQELGIDTDTPYKKDWLKQLERSANQ